jgi:hypothetical protein
MLLCDSFSLKHLWKWCAIYMIIADKYSEKVTNPQTVDQINYFQAFVIGISHIKTPVEIVDPERLKPGHIAMACEIPITNAWK